MARSWQEEQDHPFSSSPRSDQIKPKWETAPCGSADIGDCTARGPIVRVYFAWVEPYWYEHSYFCSISTGLGEKQRFTDLKALCPSKVWALALDCTGDRP